MSRYNYHRRPTCEVRIGNTPVGASNPIRLQSMTNTPTLDIVASTEQICRIAAAGADIVRLTAQGVAHAKALGEIHSKVRSCGVDVPLVADIHFNPAAAFAAAEVVEKVRINPGNFVDPGRTFKKLEYTDEEYAAEIERIRQKLIPFLELCRSHGTAVRLGVNHGSLSDRIMSRYGDTPSGMVESAMEYLRICREVSFDQVVISIKASNVVVMVATVRLLVEAMEREGMHFPLHLGVTEAGDAEDGRIKSAVGIGALLSQGIGDTIRVSLSEAPENEIPVARKIVDYIDRIAAAPAIKATSVSATASEHKDDRLRTSEQNSRPATPLAAGVDFPFGSVPEGYTLVSTDHANRPGDLQRILDEKAARGDMSPTLLSASYPADMQPDDVMIAASIDLGRLLLDGYGDAIAIEAPSMSEDEIKSLELSILQATRRRISKTEYIACPGCGRTLFDLQNVLAEVKAATSHLKGLKIGVMGCIVNGPGEMADADYGYVGAAAGHVSLYKGRECIIKNVPAQDALPQLIKLIKDCGDWHDA